MDIGRAFSYPFKDPKWLVKLVVFALLLVVPIFGWLVNLGYALKVIKNVAEGHDVPLPEWNGFGLMFANGLRAFFLMIVWLVPAAIVAYIIRLGDAFVLTLLAQIVSAFATAFFLAAIVPVALSGEIDEGLNFQAIFNRVFSNIGDYLVIIIVDLVVGAFYYFGQVGSFFATTVLILYLWLVQSHLASQAYVRSTGGAPPPRRPAF